MVINIELYYKIVTVLPRVKTAVFLLNWLANFLLMVSK